MIMLLKPSCLKKHIVISYLRHVSSPQNTCMKDFYTLIRYVAQKSTTVIIIKYSLFIKKQMYHKI